MSFAQNLPRHHRHGAADALDGASAGAADLMEAMVAGYALMAHADGEVDPAERRRIFAVLREHPAMSVYSRDELAGEIAAHEANYRLDPEVAQEIAREKLVAVKGRRRAAATVVDACRRLIEADGVAHPSEYRALAEIKALLHWDELPGRAVRWPTVPMR